MAGVDPNGNKLTPQHRMLNASAPPDFLELCPQMAAPVCGSLGNVPARRRCRRRRGRCARSNGAITLSMKVVAPGLMVTAIIYFMGTVSGAHLNPAVTLAFAVRRNFPWSRTPGYIVAQLGGEIVAAWFLRSMFGIEGSLGATTPGADIGVFKAFVMEVL